MVLGGTCLGLEPGFQFIELLEPWRTANGKYPILSRMACDFLVIPISLATSFEAFYTVQRPADESMKL